MSITIEVQNNPKATAQKYLLMHVGMNIQIDKIKKISKDECKVFLRAVLPYRITLENGDIHVGYVKFNNLGYFFVVKIKGIWKVDKSSTKSLRKDIDEILERKAKGYRKLLEVKELMWI